MEHERPPRTVQENLARIQAAYDRHHGDAVTRALVEETIAQLAGTLALLDVLQERKGIHAALRRHAPTGLSENDSQTVRAMYRPAYEAHQWAAHIREERRAGAKPPPQWREKVAVVLIRDLTAVSSGFACLRPRVVADWLDAEKPIQMRKLIVNLLEWSPDVLMAERGDVDGFVKEVLKTFVKKKTKKVAAKKGSFPAKAVRLGGTRTPTARGTRR